MYFWKYKALALALKEGRVTDKQWKIYLALFVLQMAGMVWLYATDPVRETSREILNYYVLPTVAMLLWVGGSFLINRKGDGRDFWKRFISIDLPVTVRAFLLMVLAGVLLGIAVAMQLPPDLSGEQVEAQIGVGSKVETIATVITFVYALCASWKGMSIASGQRA